MRDKRVSELVAWLEGAGAPVTDALEEAVNRSMSGTTLYSALDSVVADYRSGVWPAASETVGEDWEECQYCGNGFLPDAPGDEYCSVSCITYATEG